MRSAASTMFSTQEDEPPVETFEHALHRTLEHVAAVRRAVSDANDAPLALREHMPHLFHALEELETHEQQLGAALIRALMDGKSQELAELIEGWTHAEVQGSNGSAAATMRAEKKSASTRFVTVKTQPAKTRKSDDCVLSKIAKPPKAFVPKAEIVATEEKRPKPVDLSRVDTSAFFSNGRGFGTPEPSRHVIRPAQRQAISALVERAGMPPASFFQLAHATPFMDGLKLLVEAKNLDSYAKLPPAWHHALTDYITAYARHMQDAVCGEFSDTSAFEREFEWIFRTLTNFSKTTEPGFIYGLKKHSTPNDGEDWHESMQSRRQTIERLAEEDRQPEEETTSEEEHRSAITDVLRRLHEHVDQQNGDADAFESTLVALVEEALSHHINPQHPRLLSALQNHLERVEKHPSLKNIARALRAQEREEALAQEEREDQDTDFAATWPYTEHTEGKVLAIIGGNRRCEAEANIQDAFGFKEVVWVSTSAGKHARQRKFKSRFENGSYDYVVAIQNLVGHAWTDLIFNNAPQDTVAALTSGYGVHAVGRALARYSPWGEIDDFST